MTKPRKPRAIDLWDLIFANQNGAIFVKRVTDRNLYKWKSSEARKLHSWLGRWIKWYESKEGKG